MKLIDISPQELERIYNEENLSLSQIATRFGVNVGVIRHRLRKFGTPLRPSIRHDYKTYTITKEFLEIEYLYNRKSCKKIAKEVGCSESNIWYAISKFQIPTRSHSESNAGKTFSIAHREALSQAHLLSSKERKGSNNPNWKGGYGVSNYLERRRPEYVTWRNKALRNKGETCSKCGKNLTVSCPHCGRKFDRHVHHIQEFANNPELRFSIDNAIVLCDSCHKAHHKK